MGFFCRQIISPICAKLRIEVTPFYSERCKHVEEFIGNHKGGISQKYDTVILVSGDGAKENVTDKKNEELTFFFKVLSKNF